MASLAFKVVEYGTSVRSAGNIHIHELRGAGINSLLAEDLGDLDIRAPPRTRLLGAVVVHGEMTQRIRSHF